VRVDPQLRIYVYTLGLLDAEEMVKHHPQCKTNQWAADHYIVEKIRASHLITSNATEADFLIVPFLAKCYFNHVAHYSLSKMGAGFADVLRELELQPHWHARPDRHVFFFMSGVGASILPDRLAPLGKAVVVSAEGDREADYFRYGHDIVVPGFSTVAKTDGTAPKHLFASMRGRMEVVTRDPEGRVFYLPNVLRRAVEQVFHGQDCCLAGDFVEFEKYVEELRASCFCIIPRGSTPWTRRFFDILLAGCIPVILSNPINFPYEQLIDVRRFTIKIPESNVFSLLDELRSVSGNDIAELQSAVLRWRSAFDYGPDGLAFELFLTELSMRKNPGWKLLDGVAAPRTNNSPRHFWNPHRGVYLEPAAMKLGPTWSGGMSFH